VSRRASNSAGALSADSIFQSSQVEAGLVALGEDGQLLGQGSVEASAMRLAAAGGDGGRSLCVREICDRSDRRCRF